MFSSSLRPAIGFKKLFAIGPQAVRRQQHDTDCTVHKEPAKLQMPLSTRLMACKVLHGSRLTLSHQGRVPGQNAGKFAERGCCGRRAHGNFFSPVHVAIAHQSLPLFESVLTHAKKAFFARKCSSNWQS